MKKFVFGIGVVLLATMCMSASDKYSGTPAARTEFDKATAASQANQWDKAAAGYKKAIELDPNFSEAHEKYRFALVRNAMGDLSVLQNMSEAEQKKLSERLEAQSKAVIQEYEEFCRLHPDMPIYRWALAQHYNESDPLLQEKYCKHSVEMDPAFTPGYRCLAQVASLRGDTKAIAQNFHKLIALQPENKRLLLELTRYVREDPQECKAAAMEVVNKLPNSPDAVEALATYARTLQGRERVAALEEIVARYPLQKFRAASEAAGTLFQVYDKADPAKAAAFAHNILSAMPSDNGWKSRAAYSDALAEAEKKIAAKDGDGAMAILKDVKTPGYSFDKTRLQLLKAKAQDVSGKTADAYADLLKSFVDQPMRPVQAALYEYGKKLGKNETAVDAEVWILRSAKAKPAIPFTLESAIDSKKVSLEDFKGRVVLLDFWFPNCGPCRGSLPYLKTLWTKYKDSGLAFVGINGAEGQEPFVLPLLNRNGWGFTPLKGTAKWCSEMYKVKGFPTTFLIGADGKVYFMPHVYDESTQAIAEMQIEALLAAANGKQAN